MESLTGTAALAIIAAAVAPFLTALLNNPNTDPTRKRIIAALVAVVLGALSAIVTGQFNWMSGNAVQITTTVVVSIGLVMSLGQGFYKLFEGTVKNLELATSPGTEIEEEPADDNIPEETEVVVDDDPPEEPETSEDQER